ncbi:hypothetical protein HTZ97_16350 [Desulfuromonas acetoxidans]|uniref:Uncharacterized protein n=1 Tax=Desulfuromonas acetoxidans (strain DSM 684 / 11070) TaxID=281689 RepID=Q1K073_DESA6|nr:hypothetical protein [Desulfuromonas acetoxidans]EAT16068.1 hypothetical protein Dace_2369 [Desulfuromonas acetoxidans DSM 684]MBF0646883.1 hypothetical protein [Desulfuromonas acetoxidans]NVD26160.1 hypothetical protein [Desulfuromonas acetoxidans]NVE18028.1 hypothetical protein [Desulfuromonas acetoxidans]
MLDYTATLTLTGPLAGQPDEIINRHLDVFVTTVTAFLLREVQTRTPQGVGGAAGLLGSIQQEVTGRGTAVVRGIVATASPYGDVAERGRRPGKMPPKGALREWVAMKIGVEGRELDRVEFLVRRKIGKKGTSGAAMFSRALLENESTLQTMAQKSGMELSIKLGGQ